MAWPNVLKLKYEDAAPAAMIGASNHFEVAIATSTMLFGLVIRSGPGHGRRSSDRSAGDADAGQYLSEHAIMVQS